MRRITLQILVITISLLVLQLNAQNVNRIKRDLERLKMALQRTETLLQIIPDIALKQLISQDLRDAQEAYKKAVNFVQEGHFFQARNYIRLAFQILDKIQRFVNDHPAFKIKFKEQLDRKIQRAEGLVQATDKIEALHMLNRAKYFRQKAYLTGRGGNSYAALEYYRLAQFFADKAIDFAQFGAATMQKDLRATLVETQMLLQRARRLLENVDNPQLRNLVKRIEQEFREIKVLFENKRLAAVNQRLIILNRTLYRIIDLAEGIPVREEERLRLDIEALRTALKSIRLQVQSGEALAPKKLLNRTARLIQEIERHFELNQIKLARKKLLLANRLILKLYRMVENRPRGNPEEIADQISMARQSLNRLKEILGQSVVNNQVLNLIEYNLQRADRSLQHKRYFQAMDYLKMANALLIKANRIRLLNEDSMMEKEIVQGKLRRLSALLKRLDFEQGSDKEIQIRYENARRLDKIARQAFKQGNYALSHELLTMAIRLITK